MASKFDPTIPETESRIRSAEIRDQFNALNDRTNQLTVSARDPVATSIIVGLGDKVYFENNYYAPFSGTILDLGDSLTGISNFVSSGTFKQIIVYYKIIADEGTIGFVESTEKTTQEHSTETAAELINDVSLQRIADGSGNSISVADSPLDDSIILCSIIVTNNGQTGQRGAIESIFESDIIDLRPFLQRTLNTQALEDHINEPSLAAAHPFATINNELIEKFSAFIPTETGLITTNSIPINVTDIPKFDPSELGFQPFVRITEDSVISGGSEFQTAQVLSINTLENKLVLDHKVTVNDGYLVVRGVITLDKTTFDIVDQLSDVLERDYDTGAVQIKSGITVDAYFDASAIISGNLDNARMPTDISVNTVNADLSGDGYSITNLNVFNIADFDPEVSNNSNVVLNTLHRNTNGNPHNLTISEIDGYTKTQIDGYLDLKSDVTHNHDSTYLKIVDGYTKTQINGYLNLKSDATHNHSGVYEPVLTKGNLTESTSSILTITGGTSAVIGSGTSIQVQKADSTHDGYLSSDDWNTFADGYSKSEINGYLDEKLDKYVNVVTIGATGSIGIDDYVTAVISSSITLTLPSSPSVGEIHIIKDREGLASTGSNITIDAGSGTETIDGSNTYVMSSNYESLTVVCVSISPSIKWSII